MEEKKESGPCGTHEWDVLSSYHTFAFPFIWEQGGYTLEEMADSFQNECWTCDDMPNEWTLPEARCAMPGEKKLFYAEYQYFYPAVRNTIYGMGEQPASHRFTYRKKGYNSESGCDKMQYFMDIDLTKEGMGIVTYSLHLNGIRLRLYNTGVGILQFECENESYHPLKDVKAINEYGRRVGVPTIPCFANAVRLGIRLEGGKTIATEFPVKDEEASEIGIKWPLSYFASFLTDLLNEGNERFCFVSSRKGEGAKRRGDGKEVVFLYPAIDDRMFTHCLVELGESRGADFIGYFKSPESTDAKIEKSLYELIYVDKEEGCSAQESQLRREEIRNSAYLRWLDYGTVHAVTHHSMFMMTAGKVKEYVTNPFLTIYLELACLCLAQKASLISLQAKMTRISGGLEIDGRRMNIKKINALADLQERFVAFGSQLDFYSVTEQYQGVELYDMLRSQLYIEAVRDSLHEEIESLYETANVNQDTKFNKWAFGFALVAMLWAIASVWSDGIGVSQAFTGAETGVAVAWIVFGIAALAGLIAVGITWYIFHQNHGRHFGKTLQ